MTYLKKPGEKKKKVSFYCYYFKLESYCRKENRMNVHTAAIWSIKAMRTYSSIFIIIIYFFNRFDWYPKISLGMVASECIIGALPTAIHNWRAIPADFFLHPSCCKNNLNEQSKTRSYVSPRSPNTPCYKVLASIYFSFTFDWRKHSQWFPDKIPLGIGNNHPK